MNKSETIKELATALCKFQGAVEKIKKENTNPFFKSKYADLSSILDVIRQPLADNGLSFVQFPQGSHGLETMLMHTSGEWIAGSYEMTPTKNDPQGLGSVITYQRRYALGSILGLNIDQDDDGNKASEPAKTAVQPLSHQQQVIKYLREAKTIDELKDHWETLTEEERADAEVKRECNRIKAQLTINQPQ